MYTVKGKAIQGHIRGDRKYCSRTRVTNERLMNRIENENGSDEELDVP
jgi:hypothetical protein